MEISTYVITTLSCATFFGFLFEYTNKLLSDEQRGALACWLKNIPKAEYSGGWPSLFLDAFDTLFGKRYFSRRFFTVSAGASLASGLLVSLLYIWTVPEATSQFSGWNLIYTLVRFIALVPILNIFVDYVSIIESRWIIGIMSRVHRHLGRVFLLAADLILTGLIHLAFVVMIATLLLTIYALDLEPLSKISRITNWGQDWNLVLKEIGNSYLDSGRFQIIKHPSFSISFYTTFFTSVWVWLYFLSGYMVKASIFLRRRLGNPINLLEKRGWIDSDPLRVLGIVSMIVTIIVGSAVYIMKTIL